jgi:hypothetical protein
MPYPADYVLKTLGNRLVYDERQYDVLQQTNLHQELFTSLTGIIAIHIHPHVFIFHLNLSVHQTLTNPLKRR